MSSECECNTASAIILGMALGIFGLIGFLTVTDNIVSRAKAAKMECQKDLPRSQTCKLTAIPVDVQK